MADKKHHGEIAIKSKRGKVVKKNAEPDNPAIKIERSGNDVVKRVSEVNIEKKNNSGKKREREEAGTGDQAGEDDDGTVKNAEGKEVRAGGKRAKPVSPQANEKEHDHRHEKGAGRAKKGPDSAATKENKPNKARSMDAVSSRTRSQRK